MVDIQVSRGLDLDLKSSPDTGAAYKSNVFLPCKRMSPFVSACEGIKTHSALVIIPRLRLMRRENNGRSCLTRVSLFTLIENTARASESGRIFVSGYHNHQNTAG